MNMLHSFLNCSQECVVSVGALLENAGCNHEANCHESFWHVLTLPASICAMMPIFLYVSRGTSRGAAAYRQEDQCQKERYTVWSVASWHINLASMLLTRSCVHSESFGCSLSRAASVSTS